MVVWRYEGEVARVKYIRKGRSQLITGFELLSIDNIPCILIVVLLPFLSTIIIK